MNANQLVPSVSAGATQAKKARKRKAKKTVSTPVKPAGKSVLASDGYAMVPKPVLPSGMGGVAREISAMLTCPQDNAAKRYSSEFAGEQTALANPWDRITYPWNSTSATLAPYPSADQMVAFVFRNAVRNLVYFDPNVAGAGWSYSFYFYEVLNPTGGLAGPLNPSPPQTSAVLTTGSNDWVSLQTPYAVATTTYTPHGNTMYAGADGETDNRYFWLDGQGATQSQVTVNFTSGAATTSLRLILWDNGNLIEATPLTTTGTGAQSLTVKNVQPGYYAVQMQSTTAITVTSAYYVSNSTAPSSVWCHLPVANFDVNFPSATAVRMLAQSVMYTNDASPLNLQGKVAGLQVTSGIPWTNYASQTNVYKAVASAPGSWSSDIKEGIYGYLKPTKPTDFDLMRHYEVVGSWMSQSFYPLLETSGYLVIAGSITTAAGRDGYLTRASSLEYTTVDVWRSTCQATASPDAWSLAFLTVKGLPQWSENATHWKEFGKGIIDGIRTAVGLGRRFGPALGKAAYSVTQAARSVQR